MPVFTGIIHGNLPVEIELGSDGEPWCAFVHHRDGVVFLDFSDEELNKLAEENSGAMQQCMEEYRRSKNEK